MSRVISPVTGKPYGLAAVCRVWRLARSGVYRHRSTPPARQRRGPLGAMPDDALTTEIRGVLAASPFHGEGHRKVWARLRVDAPGIAADASEQFAGADPGWLTAGAAQP
jgi:putative transposase